MAMTAGHSRRTSPTLINAFWDPRIAHEILWTRSTVSLQLATEVWSGICMEISSGSSELAFRQSNDLSSREALVGPTLTWQTSLLPPPFEKSLECWNQHLFCRRSKHQTAMLNLLCRANLTLCPPICLCFIGILRFGKRLLGMPMNLAVLTLEKNWINQRSCCTMPGVETCSIIILPPELNDSTLSSSCLKALSPLSMLHTARQPVVSRLFLWEKQSRSLHQ